MATRSPGDLCTFNKQRLQGIEAAPSVSGDKAKVWAYAQEAVTVQESDSDMSTLTDEHLSLVSFNLSAQLSFDPAMDSLANTLTRTTLSEVYLQAKKSSRQIKKIQPRNQALHGHFLANESTKSRVTKKHDKCQGLSVRQKAYLVNQATGSYTKQIQPGKAPTKQQKKEHSKFSYLREILMDEEQQDQPWLASKTNTGKGGDGSPASLVADNRLERAMKAVEQRKAQRIHQGMHQRTPAREALDLHSKDQDTVME